MLIPFWIGVVLRTVTAVETYSKSLGTETVRNHLSNLGRKSHCRGASYIECLTVGKKRDRHQTLVAKLQYKMPRPATSYHHHVAIKKETGYNMHFSTVIHMFLVPRRLTRSTQSSILLYLLTS
jgi:hypothetical protein